MWIKDSSSKNVLKDFKGSAEAIVYYSVPEPVTIDNDQRFHL